MNERQNKILDYIIEKKKVDVTELSEKFEVSQVTIRKDLDQLEKGQMIQREHGYAVLNESDDINIRLATNYNVKKEIARKAAELIKDGDTIFIESGSCCTLLAEEIAKHKSNITIVTNSTFIASFIKNYNTVKVILSGGEYQPGSGVLVGSTSLNTFRTLYVDKCFIGVDGYISGKGFYGSDIDRSQVTRTMIQNAKDTFVLTDSSKFGRSALSLLAQPGDSLIVLTDNNISRDMKNSLITDGIRLI